MLNSRECSTVITKIVIVLILWQYLKMALFSEPIEIILTVNANCLQHSLEFVNCQYGYYANVDSSVFESL